MSEETLNRLFEQARNEAPETKLSDIQKWIGLGSLGILLAGLLTKMKLLVTLKPFIMISSVVVAVGVGAGAIVMLNSSDAPKRMYHEETKPLHTNSFSNPEPNKVELVVPVKLQPNSATVTAPVHSSEERPVLQMMEEWNNGGIHLTTPAYCLSLPVDPAKPIVPLPPFKVVRTASSEVEVDDFDALKLSGAVDVVLIAGSKAAVRLEGDDKGKESAVVKNNGKTLEIYTDCKGNKWGNDCNFKLTVYVTVTTDLNKITCTGASNLETEGELKLDKLDMNISGASEVRMDLAVHNLKIEASGASEIVLDGKADEMKLINSGATDFKAGGFEVKSATVDCSGASEVSLNVTTHLDIKASGASDVEYTGAAIIGSQSITGASDFKHK